jgi:putative flippase GtrA
VIKKEIFRFAIVGISTVAIGYLIYRCLSYLGLNKEISNGIAYCCGVVISFFANRSWTFNSESSSSITLRFLYLHGASLLACVFINSTAYYLLAETPFKFEIAFLFGIMTSTLMNFIGMKFFVFTSIRKPKHS